MASDRAERVENALLELIDSHILPYEGEDEDELENRRDDAVVSAKEILDSRATPVVSDINHAADLIKRKLVRENSSPEKALRFTNLYNRLLTQPVLSQKWAILYLLHKLSGPESRDVVSSPTRLGARASTPYEDEASSSAEDQEPIRRSSANRRKGQSQEEPAFADAFSSKGLQPLPTREGGQRDRQQVEDQFSKAYGNGKAQSKSTETKPSLLAENHMLQNPPESTLLRDLPFTLQGLSTQNLSFSNGPSLKLPTTLPIPIISLLHTLAEPSLLYRGLSDFVQSSDGGLIGQSLRAAIGGELRSYLGLVATLEGEIRRALALLDEKDARVGIGKTGVTLKRCVIWTREATMGLRLMSVIVEESSTKKGGQIISLIHGFSSSHGDPFVGAFAERLLSHVTRPFYDMLRQWIYDGELSDPFFEFFVSEQQASQAAETNGDGRGRGGATSVWEDKYKLDESMIPSIITKDFAGKVFLIGKSLNFIRYGCGDSTWVEAYSKDASKELRYGDTALLETSIDEAYKTTMARLTHLMADKFKLFEHLKALKKYLLLGQGDFIALLMESLASNLDRPTNTLYRHNLTAQLEHAIRGSNAQFDSPDVLRRLDARMLEFSHGEIGWDAFTLEYKIDAPVDVVVNQWGSKQYLKVFNFLWRVKRVEFALGSTWRRCMTGARGVLSAVADKVGPDWKIARCCIAEMIHFVCQLQYYILFEVIESSWDQLQLSISKPDCTLDDLIQAHTKYLKAITHKGLLGSARANSSAHAEDSFLTQLHGILKVMLAYKDAVDGLYSFSVAEFTRRQEVGHRIDARTAQGKWGISETDDADELLRSPDPLIRGLGADGSNSATSTPLAGTKPGITDEQVLPALRQRLQSLSSDFKARLNVLLGDLAYQPDVDMRFLGVVMNFNEVYHPVRKSRRERDRAGRLAKTPKPGKEAGKEGG